MPERPTKSKTPSRSGAAARVLDSSSSEDDEKSTPSMGPPKTPNVFAAIARELNTRSGGRRRRPLPSSSASSSKPQTHKAWIELPSTAPRRKKRTAADVVAAAVANGACFVGQLPSSLATRSTKDNDEEEGHETPRHALESSFSPDRPFVGHVNVHASGKVTLRVASGERIDVAPASSSSCVRETLVVTTHVEERFAPKRKRKAEADTDTLETDVVERIVVTRLAPTMDGVVLTPHI